MSETKLLEIVKQITELLEPLNSEDRQRSIQAALLVLREPTISHLKIQTDWFNPKTVNL